MFCASEESYPPLTELPKVILYNIPVKFALACESEEAFLVAISCLWVTHAQKVSFSSESSTIDSRQDDIGEENTSWQSSKYAVYL